MLWPSYAHIFRNGLPAEYDCPRDKPAFPECAWPPELRDLHQGASVRSTEGLLGLRGGQGLAGYASGIWVKNGSQVQGEALGGRGSPRRLIQLGVCLKKLTPTVCGEWVVGPERKWPLQSWRRTEGLPLG